MMRKCCGCDVYYTYDDQYFPVFCLPTCSGHDETILKMQNFPLGNNKMDDSEKGDEMGALMMLSFCSCLICVLWSL